MNIESAVFVKGIVEQHDILNDGIPQFAFIGRSNAGKSTLINSLTGNKILARTSATPGRTRVINFFKINDTIYFVDLPGYGYARTKTEEIGLKLNQLIEWYLFQYSKKPTVILIIDAEVGPTANDIGMFQLLQKKKREIIVIANKVDKVRKSLYEDKIAHIRDQFSDTLVIPYSSKKHIGTQELLLEIFARKKQAGKIIREKY